LAEHVGNEVVGHRARSGRPLELDEDGSGLGMADPDGQEFIAVERLQQHDRLLAHHVERDPVDAHLLHDFDYATAFGDPTVAGDAVVREGWAILDSNQGPPPYQSGALTD